MESFNKVISFILGLVVVVVFLAILSTKFNLGKKLLPLSGGVTLTATPTPTPTVETLTLISGMPTPTGMINYQNPNEKTPPSKPSSIPKTGSSTILLSLMGVSLFSGLLLRSSANKN